MADRVPLTEEERATYAWQMTIPDFGEEGQERLKAKSVLVSRCGGVGSNVAYQLAAAGVGRLVLAHAGNVKHSDLNRQLLMTHAGLAQPRVDQAKRRLLDLNPRLEIEAVGENISEENAERLVGEVDLVMSCAPLFQERLLMNREAVRQGKPLVDSAMFEMDAQLVTVVPVQTACLACLYPEVPPEWKRQFPVFGAVAGIIGCMGALEGIKVLSGMASGLEERMLVCDLRDMTFRKIRIVRRETCEVCGERNTNV